MNRMDLKSSDALRTKKKQLLETRNNINALKEEIREQVDLLEKMENRIKKGINSDFSLMDRRCRDMEEIVKKQEEKIKNTLEERTEVLKHHLRQQEKLDRLFAIIYNFLSQSQEQQKGKNAMLLFLRFQLAYTEIVERLKENGAATAFIQKIDDQIVAEKQQKSTELQSNIDQDIREIEMENDSLIKTITELKQKSMRLILLLNALSVVWASENWDNFWKDEETFYDFSAATQQIKCAHDGFLNSANSSCTCLPDFSNSDCGRRVCNNFGIPAPIGSISPTHCTCPPAFLGTNCEPVKCIPDNSNSLSARKEEKTISLLVTYNERMKEFWDTGKEELFELICEIGQGYYRNFVMSETATIVDPTADKDQCKQSIEDTFVYELIDPCQPTCKNVDASEIQNLISKTAPNSIAYIVTNVNVTGVTPEMQEKIWSAAIANRIQINVIVYDFTPSLLSSQFDNDPTLLWLKSLAYGTLGNYITANGLDKSGPNAENTITELTSLWDQGYRIAAVLSNGTTFLFTTTSDIYVSARLRLETTDLTTSAGNLTPIIDTKMWKLYKLTVSSQYLNLAFYGLNDGERATVYTKDALNVYSAFVNDVEVDAAFPLIIKGATYSLVIRAENGEIPVTSETIKVGQLLPNAGITLKRNLSDRLNCQFNIFFGNVTCNTAGPVVLHSSDQTSHTASFPIMCASKIDAPRSFEELRRLPDQRPAAQVDDETCNNVPEPPVEVRGSRSFAIVNRKCDSNKNMTDQLFRQPGNIFELLVPYLKSNESLYDNYVAYMGNLYRSDHFDIFLTKVMTNLDDFVTCDANWSLPTDLKNTLGFLNEYSDVFIIVDSAIDGTYVEEIYSRISDNRAKLYFIILESSTYNASTDYNLLNDLAVRSGGVVLRVSSVTDVVKFIGLHLSEGWVANDIAAHAVRLQTVQGVNIPNILLDSSEKYTLLIAYPPQTSNYPNAVVTFNPDTCGNATSFTTFNELQIFNINVGTSGTVCTLTVQTIFPMASLNVVLLAKSTSFVSLAFTNSPTTEYTSTSISFGTGVYPVLASVDGFNTNSQMFISHLNSSNSDIYQTNVSPDERGCNNFTKIVDYQWFCDIPSGIYHVQINAEVGSTKKSRFFPLTCLGADSGSCINGKEAPDDTCICNVGWTGNKCQLPICLNGGTVTSANVCNCPPEYSGMFCEIWNSTSSCTNSPNIPDFRSELGSLIFVVDVSLLSSTSLLDSVPDFPGTQIVVLLYGNSMNPTIVLSTTNSQLLSGALTFNETVPTGGPIALPYEAINKALDSQITRRALVVLVSQNTDFDFNADGQKMVNRLAAQRAELRIFASKKSDGVSLLGLLGNSVPFIFKKIEDFPLYFNSYIVNLFSTGNPQPILNVYASDVVNNSLEVDVQHDDNDNQCVLFVHVLNGKQTLAAVNIAVVGNGSNIYTSKNCKVSLRFTQDDAAVPVFYSIEKLSMFKSAYGFSSDASGKNELLNTGLGQKEGSISIYAINQLADQSTPDQRPKIQIRPLYSNGTFGVASSWLTTRKSSNCTYQYYAVTQPCLDNIAYQAQIITKSTGGLIRQQQVILACSSADRDCLHGTNQNGECKCNVNWQGIACSEPICFNGGTRDGSVCHCVQPTTGANCEHGGVIKTSAVPICFHYFFVSGSAPIPTTTSFAPPSTTTVVIATTTSNLATTATPSPTSTNTGVPKTTNLPTMTTKNSATTTVTPIPTPRVFVFIIDVIGSDENAFNTTLDAVNQFFSYYDPQTTLVMLISNRGSEPSLQFDYQTYDKKNISVFDSIFRNIRDSTAQPNLQLTFDIIYNSTKSSEDKLAGAKSKNIFYVTQVGGDLASKDSLDKLKTEYKFNMSSVAITPFMKDVNGTVEAQLENLSPDVTNTYWTFPAVAAMVESVSGGQTDRPFNSTPPRQPSCVNGLQANIMVIADLSKPRVDSTVDQFNSFMSLFVSGFNSLLNDANRCSKNSPQPVPTYYKEHSLFAGLSFFDNYVVTLPTFCPSSYSLVVDKRLSENSTATFSPSVVSVIHNAVTKTTCSCYRLEDPTTQTYILWMPRGGVPSEGLLEQFTSNYTHLVLPFGYTPTVGDLYYDLTKTNKNQTLFGPENAIFGDGQTGGQSASQLVQLVWTSLCRWGGLITLDTTAQPPFSYVPPPTTESPRAVLFIIDVVASDKAVFNETINTITNFMKMFNMAITQFSVIDNTAQLPSPFQLYDSISHFSDQIYNDYYLLIPQATPLLDRVFDNIYQMCDPKSLSKDSVLAQISSLYNNIFYVTQTGGSFDNFQTLRSLEGVYHFKTTSVGMASKGNEIPENVYNQLEVLGDVIKADNWYDAVNAMAVDAYGSLYTPPPTKSMFET
ncbi:unnamed protein product [Caenorhabditis auriculariae]|uniref:EGF-like domain-containing protein n=1 Tax=Caenorhabditis auriculariae TaxID=2777116 RepID=A0A8S1GQ83_9PELO|nr:unnamed protein product [Caenorhabditis auriculariae]